MAIRKYKDGYRAYFKFEGKQYSRVVGTQAEGRAWIEGTKKQLNQPVILSLSLMFSTACERYLRECKTRLVGENTFSEKRRYLREFAKYMGKQDFPVKNIDTAIARQFIVATHEERGDKAANRRRGEMIAFWNWLSEEVPRNPWKNVKKYGEEETVKYVPPAEDIRKVLAESDKREKGMLVFLLNTGARIGELYQLEWCDVSLDGDVGYVRLWTRKRIRGSRQSRNMPLTRPLRALLEELQGSRMAGDTHVFINPDTKAPYNRQQPIVRDMMSRLCSAAKVAHFGFHSLRHYFACMLAESGATLAEIQVLLGHQNATTTDRYLKALRASPVSHMSPCIEKPVNRALGA